MFNKNSFLSFFWILYGVILIGYCLTGCGHQRSPEILDPEKSKQLRSLIKPSLPHSLDSIHKRNLMIALKKMGSDDFET